ncbi:ABC transporter substrate-binding protein, partial [Patescibacteria group bacterium]|nr:ABC transporter substrate-binding protein [Patescibacteria group bacterium]
GQKEFSIPLQTLKATAPEVLFIPGYYTEAALIAQEVRAMDWDIPIIGGDGFHAPDLIEMGGKAVDGVRFTTFFVSTNPDPKVKDFVAAYQSRFGSEPGWIAAHGYDALNIIAQAIEKEGANREAIQKGLSGIENFPGVTGTISFDENGDVIKEIWSLEIKEGKFQLSGIYK